MRKHNGPLLLVWLCLTLGSLEGAILRQSMETASAPGLYEYRFLAYTPADYDAAPSKQWPLLVFLHGSGETGSNLEAVALHGPPMEIERGRNYPCVVVSPQSPVYTWNTIALAAFIDDLSHRYRINTDRIYVTGLSMGGIGAWNLALHRPDRLAAVVPVCGVGVPASADVMRNLPVWAFHGMQDAVISYTHSLNMTEAIRRWDGDPRLTLYPRKGHDVWDAVYANEQLYAWLFAQDRSARPAAPHTTPGGSLALGPEFLPEAVATLSWELASNGAYTPIRASTVSGFEGFTFANYDSASLELGTPVVENARLKLRCIAQGAETRNYFSTTVLVGRPPAILATAFAPEEIVPAGTELSLAVHSAESSVWYQWFRNGHPIQGTYAPELRLTAGRASQGSYSVKAMSIASIGIQATLELGELRVSTNGWLTNLSARANVLPGEDMLIAGFVTAGNGAGKKLLTRAVGPTLGTPPFEMNNALPAAKLTLFDGRGVQLETSQGWAPTLSLEFERLGAFALQPGAGDAALAPTLPSGAYTAQVGPAGTRSGIGLVEVYDADTQAPVERLTNLSARARVGKDLEVLIGGFVLHGTTSKTVLIRGVGPQLSRYGVSSPLAKPVLTLFDDKGQVIATNKGWQTAPEAGNSPLSSTVQPAEAALMQQTGAFPFALESADCALVATLPPGAYTAQVGSLNEATGVALVEIYEIED